MGVFLGGFIMEFLLENGVVMLLERRGGGEKLSKWLHEISLVCWCCGLLDIEMLLAVPRCLWHSYSLHFIWLAISWYLLFSAFGVYSAERRLCICI